MERTSLADSKIKRLIAYHEIGHAIVATLTPGHDPVEKVTVLPRGQALGLTWFTPDEEQGLETKTELLARITSCLGGRAAEEVIFGKAEITRGATGDINQLTSLARAMVTKLGMSDLGPLALESQNQPVFLGRDSSEELEYSEEIASRIDKEIRSIVMQCYEDAKRIIRENRSTIDRIVDLLMERETIDGEEFRKLVTEFSQSSPSNLVTSS